MEKAAMRLRCDERFVYPGRDFEVRIPIPVGEADEHDRSRRVVGNLVDRFGFHLDHGDFNVSHAKLIRCAW